MASLITGSIKVEGLADLDAALVEIGAVMGEKALRQSMLAAVRPMVEAAKVNALAIAKSGSLALAMGARFALESKAGAFFGFRDIVSAAKVMVGPLYSDRAARAAYTLYYHRGRGRHPISGGRLAVGIYHGHLVEFGTRRSRARPFLRPAFDATAEQVVANFVVELRTRIEKVRGKA